MEKNTRKNDKVTASPMRRSKNVTQGTTASEVVTPQQSKRSQGAPKKAKKDRAAIKKDLTNYFGTPTATINSDKPSEQEKGKG